jgi:hypothetical protein
MTTTHADARALAQLADDGNPHHEGRRLFHRRPPAARFWQFTPAGYVRLSLRPGEELTHTRGGPTDEGYSAEATTWAHRGDSIRQEWTSWGRDCDGSHEAGGASVCPLAQLAARDVWEETDGNCGEEARGLRFPAWGDDDENERNGWQRDHTAEAAGY